MSIYTKISTKATPQTEKAKKTQVKNSAGGYVFPVDKFAQLERFLILGTEGGTYYIEERTLTLDNIRSLTACLEEDYRRTIDLIQAVSIKGRAVKNDPAIFALAVAASYEASSTDRNAQNIRQYALSKLSDVCRIPTHLFHFATYLKQFRGFGRAVRTAIGDWYGTMPPDKLAYELAKYQSRDGMSNRDLLRLAHPDISSPTIRWAVNGSGAVTESRSVTRRLKTWTKAAPLERVDSYASHPALPAILEGVEAAKLEKSVSGVISLIKKYSLTREMIPTEFHSDKAVQGALLPHTPLHALVRNLGNMTKSGLLDAYTPEMEFVVDRLVDADYIRKSRLHPMAILIASKVYANGKGVRGSNTWKPNPTIMDALDEAFYLSFENAEPTGKRLLYALDVSGSMSSSCAGTIMTCAEGTAALAMLAIHNEKQDPYIMAFENRFVDLPLTRKMRLKDAVALTASRNFGSTDCSLPAQWALASGKEIDGIVIITDSETYMGGSHPFQVLERYRRHMGIPVRQVVIAMSSNGFTIADPSDLLSLDVVGFDASVPPVVNSFLKGSL